MGLAFQFSQERWPKEVCYWGKSKWLIECFKGYSVAERQGYNVSIFAFSFGTLNLPNYGFRGKGFAWFRQIVVNNEGSILSYFRSSKQLRPFFITPRKYYRYLGTLNFLWKPTNLSFRAILDIRKRKRCTQFLEHCTQVFASYLPLVLFGVCYLLFGFCLFVCLVLFTFSCFM